MAQVKFYSVSNAPAANAPGGNLYFVNGGELYKGSQRFGANKIFTAASNATTLSEATAGITGAIGGDVLIGFGATKIYTGNASANPSWVDVGQDQAALTSQLKSLVSGLAFDPTAGSFITGIEQDSTTGAVTAQVSNFTTAVKNSVGDGSASSVANGITVSVVTSSGSVTSVSVEAANLDVTSISASSATFTDLTVTSTATFSATTVSASSLTVNGSTVEQLADKQIAAIPSSTVTSTATGITVSVTTSGGSVTAVALNAESFTNTMHFLGVGTVTRNAQGGGITVTPP